MVFRFTILSDEIDDFVRGIDIDAGATFYDLHNAILDSVNYSKDQITSFFLCDDDWEKGQEITLMEMDVNSEYDNLVMDSTILEDYVTDEKQKLLYIFDLISDRAFFIELSEIITGKSLDKPICYLSEGNAPEQMILEDIQPIVTQTLMDDSFYGDEDFDLDELDADGFGDVSFDDNTFNDNSF